ncbi:MAG TPA: lysophospholipid acyltransferase family protein [Bdellovibrionales bacterium]|nr:lysophospholipid acyltransferase family protein [Bdellovibrionales bacterium]
MIGILTRIRAVIGAILGLLTTAFWCAAVVTAGTLGAKRSLSWMARQWGRGLLFIFGIRIDVRGAENLPAKGGGIAVFNHQSHFDIPLIFAATDRQIRFGAKIELFKIPIFGPGMRAVGTLPIARDNRSEVMRIYKDAERAFQEDIIYVLAPEGTRQKEPVIGRFKKGPFVFARNAGVPIVPVVIKGGYDVLPKSTVFVNVGEWHRTVKIEVLPSIPTAGLTPDQIEALLEKTRAQMVEAFARM